MVNLRYSLLLLGLPTVFGVAFAAAQIAAPQTQTAPATSTATRASAGPIEPELSALLAPLAGGHATPRQVKAVRDLAARCLAQASGAEETAQCEHCLGEAIAALQALVEKGKSARDEQEILQWLQDRLDLACAIGLTQTAGGVRKMQFMHGSAADARQVQQFARQSLKMLDDLAREGDNLLERWRGDPDKIAIGAVQQLEEFLPLVQYKRAWVQFDLAEAMNPAWSGEGNSQASTRDALLQSAISAVKGYAEGDAGTGVKYWSLLLCGRAERELGKADASAMHLAKAADNNAEREVQLQALFELVKVAVGRKQWDLALRQIEFFRQRGQQLLSQDKLPGLELQAALLTNYLYHQRALEGTAGDEAASKAFEEQAERPVIDFLQKYPPLQATLCAILSDGEEQGADPRSASPLTVVVRAISLMKKTPPEYVPAVTLLREVLARQDAPAVALRPLALWNLAAALCEQADGDRQEAVSLFERLAEEFPRDANALPAARNAVLLTESRVAKLEQVDAAVPAAAREDAVRAMEILLKHWGDPENLQQYAFPLAMQYKLLGRREQSMAWLHRVPPTSPNAGEADFECLTLRYEGLGEQSSTTAPATSAEASDASKALLADLHAFSDAALQRAQQMADPLARAGELQRGAQADLLAAELLATQLKQADPALRQLDALAQRWPGEKDVLGQAEAFRVTVLLEQGEVQAAVEGLQRLQATDPAQAKVLVTSAIARIRERIEALRDRPEKSPELAQWQKAYAEFAQRAFEAVKSEPPPRQYPYRQMLAEAWMETGRAVEARRIFQELEAINAADVQNIHGQARCSWLLQDYSTAIALYQRLLAGLDAAKYAKLWWRNQLELAQCGFDTAQDDPSQLKRLAVRLRQLRTQDETFGGFVEAFNLLEKKVQQRLATLG